MSESLTTTGNGQSGALLEPVTPGELLKEEFLEPELKKIRPWHGITATL